MSLHPLDGKQFRARLVLLRNAKGLKQEQLSERIGRAYNYISRVETGRVKTVPFDVLAKLALALDVTIDDLLFVDGLAETSDDIKARIHRLLEASDVKKLRKFYRLLLVTIVTKDPVAGGKSKILSRTINHSSENDVRGCVWPCGRFRKQRRA